MDGAHLQSLEDRVQHNDGVLDEHVAGCERRWAEARAQLRQLGWIVKGVLLPLLVANTAANISQHEGAARLFTAILTAITGAPS